MRTIPETLLGEIVRRLVVEFDPEAIIAFGSRAWGRPHEDSDLDLLAIVSDSDDRPTRAHRCLRAVPVPMDILVPTRREFDLARRVPASSEAEVVERGEFLHGRSSPAGP